MITLPPPRRSWPRAIRADALPLAASLAVAAALLVGAFVNAVWARPSDVPSDPPRC